MKKEIQISLMSVIWASLFWISFLHAEPLALVHDATAACKDGGLRQACTTGRIDIPKAGDLVALCPNTSGCWDGAPVMQLFEKVPATTTIDGCDNSTVTRTTPLAQRTLPFVWSTAADPCKGLWKAFPAGTFAAMPVNKTGTISLSIYKPDFTVAGLLPESALTGFQLYSCAILANDNCTLTFHSLIPVGANPIIKSIPGYGNGKYSFAASAMYGTIESGQTGPVKVEVKIPVPDPVKIPGKPSSLSITSVTIE